MITIDGQEIIAVHTLIVADNQCARIPLEVLDVSVTIAVLFVKDTEENKPSISWQSAGENEIAITFKNFPSIVTITSEPNVLFSFTTDEGQSFRVEFWAGVNTLHSVHQLTIQFMLSAALTEKGSVS